MYKNLNLLILFLLGNALHGQGLGSFNDLLKHEFRTTDSLELALIEAEQDYHLKDKGIRFQTSVGSNEFGDLDQGNTVRFRAGLEWNLMDEGLLDRKRTAKILEIQKSIKNYEIKKNAGDRNYLYQYNFIIYSFNASKLQYLKDKKYLLNILIKRYEALYHTHGADYQDLLALYDQAEEVKILEFAIHNYNKHFQTAVWRHVPGIMPTYLPILDIDVERLMTDSHQDFDYLEILSLKSQKLELENKSKNQTRLSIYNNAYWRPVEDPNSSRAIFNNIGIRFSTSLANREKEKSEIAMILAQLESQKIADQDFNIQKELINYILEYHSKLRLYNRFYFNLKSLDEHKRLDHAVKLVNTETPQSDLKTLQIELQRLNVLYEMSEIKQHLYLTLLKIYHLSGVSDILNYVSEKPMEMHLSKVKGARILLLGVNDFKVYDPFFISEYLKENGFFDVLLTGDTSLRIPVARHLEEAGIRVYDKMEAFSFKEILEVPLEQFDDRISMEYWIADHYLEKKNALFLVSDFQKLLLIDTYSLVKE